MECVVHSGTVWQWAMLPYILACMLCLYAIAEGVLRRQQVIFVSSRRRRLED